MVDLILELLRCFALVVRAETCCCLGCSALFGLLLVGLSSYSLHAGGRLAHGQPGLLMLYRRENEKRPLRYGRSDGLSPRGMFRFAHCRDPRLCCFGWATLVWGCLILNCASGTSVGTSVGTTL